MLPKIGECVLVFANSPRSQWQTAIVKEIYLNTNNRPISALIKFPSGHTVVRSVAHLCPLETAAEFEHRNLPPPATPQIPDTFPSIPVAQDEPFPSVPVAQDEQVVTETVPPQTDIPENENFLTLRNRRVYRKQK